MGFNLLWRILWVAGNCASRLPSPWARRCDGGRGLEPKSWWNDGGWWLFHHEKRRLWIKTSRDSYAKRLEYMCVWFDVRTFLFQIYLFWWPAVWKVTTMSIPIVFALRTIHIIHHKRILQILSKKYTFW